MVKKLNESVSVEFVEALLSELFSYSSKTNEELKQILLDASITAEAAEWRAKRAAEVLNGRGVAAEETYRDLTGKELV